MKKFLMISLLIFAALFAFSCASDDDEEEMNGGNGTDTTPGGSTGEEADSGADTVPAADENDSDKTDTVSEYGDDDKTDTVSEYGDSDTSDNSVTDNETINDADNPDFAPDDGSQQSDDTDNPSSDSGDSAPDENNEGASDIENSETSDNDGEPLTGLPECSKNSAFPCEDSSTHLLWSAKTTATYNWSDLKNYCLTMGNGWHLPTIDELRTLVLGCDETAPNGACNVKEGCLSNTSSCYTTDDCISKNCPTKTDGSHSKFGDTEFLCSSSEQSDDASRAWGINFKIASIGTFAKTDTERAYARCVKNQ